MLSSVTHRFSPLLGAIAYRVRRMPISLHPRWSLGTGNVPLVLIDRRVEGVDVPFVEADHEAGAYEVVRHLISQGHPRIGHITFGADGDGAPDAVLQREEGYRRAMIEAGIDVPCSTSSGTN